MLCTDIARGTPLRQDERPASGDVLITTEHGIHLLSVVPHPHRLSFSELSQALEIAEQWARANGGDVWRANDGQTSRIPLDGSKGHPPSISRSPQS